MKVVYMIWIKNIIKYKYKNYFYKYNKRRIASSFVVFIYYILIIKNVYFIFPNTEMFLTLILPNTLAEPKIGYFRNLSLNDLIPLYVKL